MKKSIQQSKLGQEKAKKSLEKISSLVDKMEQEKKLSPDAASSLKSSISNSQLAMFARLGSQAMGIGSNLLTSGLQMGMQNNQARIEGQSVQAGGMPNMPNTPNMPNMGSILDSVKSMGSNVKKGRRSSPRRIQFLKIPLCGLLMYNMWIKFKK